MPRKKIEVQQIEDEINEEVEAKEVSFEKMISTGSTLLDLAISGDRCYEGGVPGGIIIEIAGPSAAGKTAILTEMAVSAQTRGGEARFDDPEARLNQEYTRIYGLQLEAENYNRPDTVKEMFNGLWAWEPKNKDVINISCEDSLAALSTEMEMESEDKYGMKRAKEFSEGLRKTCRMIANNNWIIACSNQERDGTTGTTTPGGKAIPYYSSLRIRIAPYFKGSKIKRTKTINGKTFEKIIGIRSLCTIIKSSIDAPHRTANIFIVFGVGVDDIRGNLFYLKDVNGTKKYECPDGESYVSIEKAIEYVENHDLEEDLRKQTIEKWHEINDAFKTERKPKKRR